MNKNIDAIIQARLGSKRFPKKVLAKINGIPLIDIVIERIKKSNYINRVIIATTNDNGDDELINYCKAKKYLYFRGDRDNVLNRFIGACQYFNCNKIIRVCSDNPFIDLNYLNKQLSIFSSDDNIDYCTYSTFDQIPIILKPIGLFVEAVTLNALLKVTSLTKIKKYYEHVTMFIYENAGLFNIKSISLDKSINTDFRFTIDYPEDLIFCEKIIKETKSQSMKNIFNLLSNNKPLQKKMILFSNSHKKKY